MLHDLCHCTHNQVSGSSSSREEEMMNEMAGEVVTQSQQDTLCKFREILAEQGLLRKRDDDYTLLRFLRARGFDIAKAKSMFEAMLEWRKEIGADTIREVQIPTNFFFVLNLNLAFLRYLSFDMVLLRFLVGPNV